MRGINLQRASIALMIALTVLLLVRIVIVRDDRGASNRRIVAVHWDTVFHIGSADAADTILLTPYRAYLWGDRIVVLDGRNKRFGVFSSDGRLLWMYGRRGSGPGEFVEPIAAEIAPNGNLWILDAGNRRLTEFSAAQRIIREIPLHHFPTFVADLARVGDHVFFVTVGRRIVTTRLPGFTVESVTDNPWPETIPPRSWPRVTVAANSEGGTWALAFLYGPGFIVWSNGNTQAHRYIDSVSFVVGGGVVRVDASGKPTASSYVPVPDKISFGAHQIVFARGELYVLFGGVRDAHGQRLQLTRFIDVYGADGRYLRSYQLPFQAEGMTTDGRTFYVLREEPYPALFALRPRRE